MTRAERQDAEETVIRMLSEWRRLKHLTRETESIYNHVEALGDDLAAIESDVTNYAGRTDRSPALART
ncbi:MAG: hypothetical protein A2W00_04625 [Candidatus Eisenbacteria bacterium RBG_16_71_46]|nr:MAG: hypothetical protein A2W00_04625 [Candidatus Eisenbacteria bacterium RBG_16_71_46]